MLLDYEDADDRYKLPWHCKCVAHLLNLLARKNAEKALETPAFKQVSDSALTKLQSLFNKQSRSDQHSEKVKELLGTLTKNYNFLS